VRRIKCSESENLRKKLIPYSENGTGYCRVIQFLTEWAMGHPQKLLFLTNQRNSEMKGDYLRGIHKFRTGFSLICGGSRKEKSEKVCLVIR
jgi:hypothetical protein